MHDPDDTTDFPVVAAGPNEPTGKPCWTYSPDTKQVWDEWTEEGIAENYGDEDQGWLLAAAPDLLAIAQKLIAYRDTEAGFDLMDLVDEAERVVAKTAGRKGEGR
jgi:hypothetical protein